MLIELHSKLIDAAEYDGSRLKLYLSTGQIREYRDVPSYVVDDLQASRSPGNYYVRLIRRRYPEGVGGNYSSEQTDGLTV